MGAARYRYAYDSTRGEMGLGLAHWQRVGGCIQIHLIPVFTIVHVCGHTSQNAPYLVRFHETCAAPSRQARSSQPPRPAHPHPRPHPRPRPRPSQRRRGASGFESKEGKRSCDNTVQVLKIFLVLRLSTITRICDFITDLFAALKQKTFGVYHTPMDTPDRRPRAQVCVLVEVCASEQLIATVLVITSITFRGEARRSSTTRGEVLTKGCPCPSKRRFTYSPVK